MINNTVNLFLPTWSIPKIAYRFSGEILLKYYWKMAYTNKLNKIDQFLVDFFLLDLFSKVFNPIIQQKTKEQKISIEKEDLYNVLHLIEHRITILKLIKINLILSWNFVCLVFFRIVFKILKERYGFCDQFYIRLFDESRILVFSGKICWERFIIQSH